MPVHTIRSKHPKNPEHRDTFVRQVRKQTRAILASAAPRVLVVYGKEKAEIYYETSGVMPVAEPKTASRSRRD
jgi:hypothetical protein